MSFTFEVLAGGLGNTLQDAGRFGFRHQGMPVSGFLDAPLAHCANALVGNPADTTCLEMRLLGPTLQVTSGFARVAIAGDAVASVQRASGVTQALANWHSVTLREGDTLTVGAIKNGCAYVSFAGGLALTSAMGSESTYVRVGVGGLNGRALAAGDRLPGRARAISPDAHELRAPEPFCHKGGPIRVMLGPQADHFSPDARRALTTTTWTTTPEQDRMGVRLAGVALEHQTRAHADIVSDGIAPGTIQVPGNGQPIVLLADCHTVGGYPKIATVISADLPRLAHMPAGTAFQFEVVSGETACMALGEADAALQAWLGRLQRYAPSGFLDEQALYAENLVSGMCRAE